MLSLRLIEILSPPSDPPTLDVAEAMFVAMATDAVCSLVAMSLAAVLHWDLKAKALVP